jgi:hypothetical protein
MSEDRERLWRFRFREGGYEHTATIWLYPELDCSACIDDADDQSGPGQLAHFVDYVRNQCPEWWAADAVPIYWCVRGEPGVCEQAPVANSDENFLTFFTKPEDAETGERLNWWKLPVRNTRFPAFARALAWTPSPFQPFAPLRSIVTNAVGERRPSFPASLLLPIVPDGRPN